jgi:hypothetical protein
LHPAPLARFEVTPHHRGARYEIAVFNPAGVNRGLVSLELDGASLSAQQGLVPLVADGAAHRVRYAWLTVALRVLRERISNETSASGRRRGGQA